MADAEEDISKRKAFLDEISRYKNVIESFKKVLEIIKTNDLSSFDEFFLNIAQNTSDSLDSEISYMHESISILSDALKNDDSSDCKHLRESLEHLKYLSDSQYRNIDSRNVSFLYKEYTMTQKKSFPRIVRGNSRNFAKFLEMIDESAINDASIIFLKKLNEITSDIKKYRESLKNQSDSESKRNIEVALNNFEESVDSFISVATQDSFGFSSPNNDNYFDYLTTTTSSFRFPKETFHHRFTNSYSKFLFNLTNQKVNTSYFEILRSLMLTHVASSYEQSLSEQIPDEILESYLKSFTSIEMNEEKLVASQRENDVQQKYRQIRNSIMHHQLTYNPENNTIVLKSNYMNSAEIPYEHFFEALYNLFCFKEPLSYDSLNAFFLFPDDLHINSKKELFEFFNNAKILQMDFSKLSTLDENEIHEISNEIINKYSSIYISDGKEAFIEEVKKNVKGLKNLDDSVVDDFLSNISIRELNALEKRHIEERIKITYDFSGKLLKSSIPNLEKLTETSLLTDLQKDHFKNWLEKVKNEEIDDDNVKEYMNSLMHLPLPTDFIEKIVNYSKTSDFYNMQSDSKKYLLQSFLMEHTHPDKFASLVFADYLNKVLFKTNLHLNIGENSTFNPNSLYFIKYKKAITAQYAIALIGYSIGTLKNLLDNNNIFFNFGSIKIPEGIEYSCFLDSSSLGSRLNIPGQVEPTKLGEALEKRQNSKDDFVSALNELSIKNFASLGYNSQFNLAEEKALPRWQSYQELLEMKSKYSDYCKEHSGDTLGSIEFLVKKYSDKIKGQREQDEDQSIIFAIDSVLKHQGSSEGSLEDDLNKKYTKIQKMKLLRLYKQKHNIKDSTVGTDNVLLYLYKDLVFSSEDSVTENDLLAVKGLPESFIQEFLEDFKKTLESKLDFDLGKSEIEANAGISKLKEELHKKISKEFFSSSSIAILEDLIVGAKAWETLYNADDEELANDRFEFNQDKSEFFRHIRNSISHNRIIIHNDTDSFFELEFFDTSDTPNSTENSFTARIKSLDDILSLTDEISRVLDSTYKLQHTNTPTIQSIIYNCLHSLNIFSKKTSPKLTSKDTSAKELMYELSENSINYAKELIKRYEGNFNPYVTMLEGIIREYESTLSRFKEMEKTSQNSNGDSR